jgi:Na+/melibiose symporter-like transporter
VVDYEELLHGVRSEGTFSVYNTLVNKTVAIPGSAIPLGILSMLGFVYPINGVDQVGRAQPTH